MTNKTAELRRSDFNFELPDRLIARYPTPQRTESRLLELNRKTGALKDRQFTDLCDLIEPNDLLVFNNTRVIPARLYGYKSTGGAIELLIERILSPNRFLAHLRASKSPKPGASIYFTNNEMAPIEEMVAKATVISRQETLFEIELEDQWLLLPLLEKIGHIPLPPYIDRPDESLDKERYQTVYNKIPGAVAAPTAGLHFDQAMLDKLQAKNVSLAFVTLHVGAGTFQPVRVDQIIEHKMHAEYVEVTQETIDAIEQCKSRNGRVIAVGTTSVRSLESMAQKSLPKAYAPFSGDTDIFIYPGYQFQVIDALITNFHLPESTLIMLISALSTRENILAAYQHAIEQDYRFFSYGDAMFIS